MAKGKEGLRSSMLCCSVLRDLRICMGYEGNTGSMRRIRYGAKSQRRQERVG